MAIYRGPGGSGDATDDAASAAELIVQKTVEATNAATSASNSATAAANSATSAAASASGVAGYAAAAAASAAAALSSKNNAATSETNAAISAANADEDAGTASTKATEAAASASAAASSASSASTSASSAATSASSASSSATSAASSASSASTSAGNAAISASNAASSATTAAGYVPSLTGNNGKYLRTNGTSNYWDIVDSFPSQTGNNGKFLTTNGTSVSWANVPNPSEAAALVSGLVFGRTDATVGMWSGTITNTDGSHTSGYNELVTCSTTCSIFVTSGSPLQQAITAGQVVVGQGISINDGTSTLSFGTVQAIAGTSPTFVLTTSSSGWGAIGTDIKTIYQVILVGATGGNAALGHNILSSLNKGSYNTILGFDAGSSIVNGNNNIVIGYNANTSGDVSNEVTIGNTSITKTRLRGALLVGNSSPSAGTSGQVLTSNGASAEPSWTTITTGTVTSVGMTVPTGLSIAGSPITSSGTLAVTFASGYSIPTTSSQTNWDTAFGWGNHASAGYLTSAAAASTYQPLDGDLTSIAGLTGTTGLLKKTAANTWSLDTTTYVPTTGTGATGTWGISISGNAATVTNGLYSTGSYADPTWLTSLAGSKITGTINGGTY